MSILFAGTEKISALALSTYQERSGIDAAKKLASILDTTVGYLLGENQQSDLFKDPVMLKRFQDIVSLPERDRDCLLLNVDNFIKATKLNNL